MRFRSLASMISTANDYSLLRWPLITVSVLITLLAFLLLLSFQSNAWFTYESYDTNEKSTELQKSIKYPRSVEYGSFGLWSLCIEHYNDLNAKCDSWIKQTRPEHFSVILILLSCALFLANAAVFPAWAASILILYNLNNRYIRYIVVFLWIVLFLSLLFTCILICIMIVLGLTKYYSPGKFVLATIHISFHAGPGIYYMIAATTLAVICLILLFVSLVWKKFIETRLIEEEKELYRQLTDDNYAPSWHKVIMIPRTSSTNGNHFGDPPPYNPDYERS